MSQYIWNAVFPVATQWHNDCPLTPLLQPNRINLRIIGYDFTFSQPLSTIICQAELDPATCRQYKETEAPCADIS
jgi:hypothetical protein